MGKKILFTTQTIRFLVTGGVVSGVNVGFLYIFTEVMGLWYLASSVVVSIISLVLGFVMQKWWTFNERSRSLIKRQSHLYILLAIANLLLNVTLMFVLTDTLGIWYVVSQIITLGSLSALNFFMYRNYIFIKLD